MLVIREGALWAGHPYVWADWSMHTGLVSLFAYRPPQEWFTNHPYGALLPLNYPFVTNFLSGMLVRIGVTLSASMIVPSFVFSVFSVVVLVYFFKTMKFSRVWSLIASLLFWFSGGIGFFAKVLQTNSLEFVMNSKTILTQMSAPNIQFTNIFMGMLLPQRAFLLGLPVGLYVLSVLYRFAFVKIKKAEMIAAAVLLGVLPIIHTHTFIVCMVVGGWWALLSLKRIKQWLLFGLVSVPIATLMYLIFIRSTITAHFFSWHPGWYVTSGVVDWLQFWLVNWGVFGVVALLGTISLFFVNKKMFLRVLPWWFLFALANMIQFQPQTWDNSKLLAWAYLGFCIPVTYLLQMLWQRKPLKSLVVILFIASVISGAVDVAHLLDFQTKSYQMLSPGEITFGQWVRENTPTNAVFLTSDWVNNAVPMIAGRSIILGYPGWIFSYGFPYQDRQRDIALMYKDPAKHADLFAKYHVAYVVLGPQEQKYNPDESYFEKHFVRVYSDSGISLYKAKWE